jgi:hypothetical protein
MLHHQDNWEWQVSDGRVACFDYTQLRLQAASEGPRMAGRPNEPFSAKHLLQPCGRLATLTTGCKAHSKCGWQRAW